MHSSLHALLNRISDALCEVGVPASPYSGLGVMRGDEILDASVQVSDTDRLYELMQADGFDAEPDWFAEPFPATGRGRNSNQEAHGPWTSLLQR